VVTGKEIKTLLGHLNFIRGLFYTPDGRYMVSSSWDTTIKIWNPQSGKLVKTIKPHSNLILSMDLSSDGKYLASSSSDLTIQVAKFADLLKNSPPAPLLEREGR